MTEKQELECTEWIISAEGYKRFRGWERTITKYPLPGVVPSIFASRMVWADAENCVAGFAVTGIGERRRAAS